MMHARRPTALWLLVVLALLAGGCATGPVYLNQSRPIADVQRMPQDPRHYAEGVDIRQHAGSLDLHALNQRYDERFFAPWKQETSAFTADQAAWGIQSYGSKQGWAENLRPRHPDWLPSIIQRAGMDAFPGMARRAIALRNTNLRVFPTPHPFFYDPHEGGEGFPFDYFQNSAVWTGTPLFISHASLDKAWLFAEAPFAAGWVRAEDIAWVDDDFIRTYRTGGMVAVTRDYQGLYGVERNRYLAMAHIGALFPQAPQVPGLNLPGQAVYVPVADSLGNAVPAVGWMPAEGAAPAPLPLQAPAIAAVAKEMAGQKYGWGGMFENRDCSAALRDLLTPFGIWLPRNSRSQSKAYRAIDLSQMSGEQKERALLERGVPFLTLVYMPGHIMLYIGQFEGRAAVFHNMWGIRTIDRYGRSGRNIVGQAVITTLQPGIELDNADLPRADLRERISAMVLVGQPRTEAGQ